MIRLITGATLVSGRLYRPESGAFSADKETEKYLINRGVAVAVDNTQTTSSEAIAGSEPDAPDAPDLTAEVPEVSAETPTKKPAAKKPAGKKS